MSDNDTQPIWWVPTTGRCTCPSGLGYRFHRHPCPRTGEIEDTVTPPEVQQ